MCCITIKLYIIFRTYRTHEYPQDSTGNCTQLAKERNSSISCSIKKNASTWIPRARRPTTSQGLSDDIFRVKSSGKLIVLRLYDTRVDASTWNSSTDRGQLIEECHIKQARAKLMCSKKEGDCLGKTHTHTHRDNNRRRSEGWQRKRGERRRSRRRMSRWQETDIEHEKGN